MKAFLLHFFKKPAFAFFAGRFALLTGIIVFAVSMGKSQTNTTNSVTNLQTMNSGAEIANTVILKPIILLYAILMNTNKYLTSPINSTVIHRLFFTI